MSGSVCKYFVDIKRGHIPVMVGDHWDHVVTRHCHPIRAESTTLATYPVTQQHSIPQWFPFIRVINGFHWTMNNEFLSLKSLITISLYILSVKCWIKLLPTSGMRLAGNMPSNYQMLTSRRNAFRRQVKGTLPSKIIYSPGVAVVDGL